MADRSIPLRTLRKILRSFDVGESSSRGKGSHTTFFKKFSDGTFSYPVPTSKKDVKVCYVTGCWKRFRLHPEDGVTDEDFYARA